MKIINYIDMQIWIYMMFSLYYLHYLYHIISIFTNISNDRQMLKNCPFFAENDILFSPTCAVSSKKN